MELLSAQSFSEAMMRCYDNQRYKVGIAFCSTVTYLPFVNELGSEYRDTKIPGVYRVEVRTDGGRILFENGSCIDMFIARENQRGRKCNEILYDGSIEEEVVNTTLRPMLVTYKNLRHYDDRMYSRGFVDDYADESDELDDFIKSFKIDTEKRCSAT